MPPQHLVILLGLHDISPRCGEGGKGEQVLGREEAHYIEDDLVREGG
jgi:hypothetical protein